jgi:hypothetical protein
MTLTKDGTDIVEIKRGLVTMKMVRFVGYAQYLLCLSVCILFLMVSKNTANLNLTAANKLCLCSFNDKFTVGE